MVWQIKNGKATLTDLLLYAGLASPFPDKLKQTVYMHLLVSVFVSSFAVCMFVLVFFVERGVSVYVCIRVCGCCCVYTKCNNSAKCFNNRSRTVR